nr:MAG TPA: Putative ATP dependent Clp protease [Caudoviricetes sp.]
MTFLIYEDIGPAPEIAQRAWDIPDGEDVEIRINSCGGDVFGGLAIVAAIHTFRENGHKTRAVVEGLAASMASVVACACDELQMHDGSMMMIHNPWTLIEGDAEELRKQAEIMSKIKNTMIGVYQKKFAMSSEEISRLMDEETWIGTDELERYKLNATVIEGTYRIAASVTKEQYYAHLKERRMMNEKDEDKDEQKPTEQTDENPAEEKPADDKPAEEKPAEEQKPDEDQTPDDKPDDKPDEDEDEDEKTIEELRERIDELVRENEELRKQLDAPVEDRVRGMQSKMQSRINAREKEFEKQLQARTEELTNAQATVTSLRADLEKVTNELQSTASALATKTHALETLNSGVLTPHAAVPTPRTRDEARRALAKLPMGERAEFYKTHRALIDG